MIRIIFFVALFTLLISSNGFSQILMDPSTVTKQGQSRVGFGLAISELDYDTGSTTPEFKRKTLGVTFDYGVANRLDITGQFGYIMDLEIESNSDDGKGFVFGFGGRCLIHSSYQFRVYGYSFFAYQKEEIDRNSYGKSEITTYDLHLGGIVGFPLSPKMQPYLGLDLIPMDDGEIKTTIGSYSGKTDIERDDIVNIKLGLDAFFDNVLIRPELTLFGEQTIVLSAAFSF